MSNETETESAPTPNPETTTEATSQTSTEESLIGGKTEDEAPKEESLIGGKVDEEKAPEFGLDAVDADNLEIPETIELSEEQTTEFTELVNNAESKVDLANKLMSMYATVATEAATAGAKAFVEMNETWIKEIETDIEFGGDRQEQSLAVAKDIVDRYGSGPGFNKILHLTGMGNNVEFLRFLHKVNADLPQQAAPATGNPASGSRSLADRLFTQA